MEELRKKKGFICDMDGVIYHGNKLLPGVKEFVDWLYAEKKNFLFLTNSSERSPKELQQKLRRMGLEVDESHFYTSALATARFISSQAPGCSAYVIGENNEIMHSSDDGEPSGTAGRPMLSVLTGQDVHNVAAVVTRYFGGVLLGTGGLVRAYQGAVSEALLHAEIRQQLLMQELMLTAEYTDVGKIQYLLSQAGFRTADTEYGAKVLFHVLVPAGEEDAAIKLLTEKTNGKTGITKGELRNETCE